MLLWWRGQWQEDFLLHLVYRRVNNRTKSWWMNGLCHNVSIFCAETRSRSIKETFPFIKNIQPYPRQDSTEIKPVAREWKELPAGAEDTLKKWTGTPENLLTSFPKFVSLLQCQMMIWHIKALVWWVLHITSRRRRSIFICGQVCYIKYRFLQRTKPR